MYLVKKSAEPKSLITERESHKDRLAEPDYKVWSYLQAQTKADIKTKLLEEQRGVCCYCTSRINAETCRVEHWEPQSLEPGKRLSWSNLLAACPGMSGASHCDVLKGARRVVINPQNEGHIRSLRYSNSGKMTSSSKGLQAEIDDVLGLNIVELMRARKEALRTFLSKWAPKRETLAGKKKKLAERVRRLIDKNPADPFLQIVLYYLTKDSNWTKT